MMAEIAEAEGLVAEAAATVADANKSLYSLSLSEVVKTE